MTKDDEIYALKAHIRDLEKMLGQEYRAPAILRLTSGEHKMLGLLRARDFVSQDSMFTLLYGDRVDPPTINVVRARISHLRFKMFRHGMTVAVTYGDGYYLSKETRLVLKGLEDAEKI